MATQKEIEYLNNNFDYPGLKDCNFYNSNIDIEDYDAQIKRICEYFRLNNIFEYETVMIRNNKPIDPDIETFSEN